MLSVGIVFSIKRLMGRRYDDPMVEKMASFIIGAILVAVAIYLAYESRGLLIDERADPELVENIRRLVRNEPGVVGVGRILTMQMRPDSVLIAAKVSFGPDLSRADIEETVAQLEQGVRGKYPSVKHIFIQL